METKNLDRSKLRLERNEVVSSGWLPWYYVLGQAKHRHNVAIPLRGFSFPDLGQYISTSQIAVCSCSTNSPCKSEETDRRGPPMVEAKMLIFGSVISGIRMSLSACAAGHGERQAVSTRKFSSHGMSSSFYTLANRTVKTIHMYGLCSPQGHVLSAAQCVPLLDVEIALT
jgi:hypothetical protein